MTGAIMLAAALRVACVGDSITYGYCLANRERDSYPAQLQRELDAGGRGRYEVRNFGNPGRGIYLDSMRGREKRGYRWMKEHAAALAWKPDIVVCNLGINDCGEYIKEYTGRRERGQFRDDYLKLLADYRLANPKVKFFIWTKLAPLAPGHAFYRSPDPMLMQADLDEVAVRANATGIDMLEPLREKMDLTLAKDKVHPDAEGSLQIARATAQAIVARPERATPPPKSAAGAENWLCAGQSNMQQGWNDYAANPEERARAKAELARLRRVKVSFWDFTDSSWKKLSPQNAGGKCAFGVSFAVRRAEATGKRVNIFYVAAGGAPTEAFLSEATMCAVGPDGKPKYPNLCRIATNRHQIDANGDFPCLWCKREYPRRKNNAEEAAWWPVARMYDRGIKVLERAGVPLTGILWYQGESNATTNVKPDQPLSADYMLETNLAIVEQLRGGRDIPFVMVGLPAMDRPWAPYRAAQAEACRRTGTVFVDTFALGLGEPGNVHPRNKIPFAEAALAALP